jgi:CubicO group peptidase (beta-lactamase class C family)
MAAALVVGERLAAQATAGVLVYGSQAQATSTSRFHIGSTTKTLTALLVEQLVQAGELRYDSTLGEILRDVPMRDAYRRVTLRDLLLSKAGLCTLQAESGEDPAVAEALWTNIPRGTPEPLEQRAALAHFVLDLEPEFAPGSRHSYSNVGWAVVGHLVERVTRESFETLLAQRVFAPLGMRGAQIGAWPASLEDPDQPRGHYVSPTEVGPRSQPLDDAYVFPAWMNPAGGVHCTIGDLAAYAQDQLSGLGGSGRLLPHSGYLRLHSVQDRVDVREMYAASAKALAEIYGTELGGEQNVGFGWALADVDGGTLSACDGSGGTFFARMLIYPPLNAAFVGVTNAGDGARALDAALERMTGFRLG